MTEDIRTEKVELRAGKPPRDYHCKCRFCKQFIGELVRPDGAYYSKNDRRKYYSKVEISASKEGAKGGHVAKTPLHIARWAIQQFTKPKDWVLDPTIGAGTTAVEALNHGRSVAGMEIEFIDVIKANLQENNPLNLPYQIWHGDARVIGEMLGKFGKKFSLIVNNPPYSGDESQKGFKREGFEYSRELPNIAFLKEGEEYYATMGAIYRDCAKHLRKGGYLVIGVKDQMRNKKPDELHRKLAECVEQHVPGMGFVGVAILKHHPGTLFTRTYFKQYGIHPPYYQTIVVFQKVR